tara:strand:+ start:424 stop:1029 length:606 start_codon:yes stop_codon:yes gene_type:complete
MKPSQEYHDLIDSYKVLHQEEGKFKGISLVPLVPTLIHLIKENKCKTLLDYGCGKAIPYDKERCKEVDLRNPIQELCNLKSFNLYDPAYEKYATLPDKKYDIVVCTDVLEHIAEQDIDYVLTEILSRSKKIVFLNISCQPALKHFKEGKFKGKNVHISVFDPSWWMHKIGNIWNKFNHLKVYTLCETKEGTHATCIKKEKE